MATTKKNTSPVSLVDFTNATCMYAELKPTISRRIFVVVDDLEGSLANVMRKNNVNGFFKDEWKKKDGRYRMVAVILKNRYSNGNYTRFMKAMEEHYKKAAICGWTVEKEFKIIASDMKRIAVRQGGNSI